MLLLDYRSDLILLSYCSCRKYVKRDLIIWSEAKIWNSVCCNKGVEPREGGIAFVFLLLFTRSMEPNMRIDSHCSHARLCIHVLLLCTQHHPHPTISFAVSPSISKCIQHIVGHFSRLICQSGKGDTIMHHWFIEIFRRRKRKIKFFFFFFQNTFMKRSPSFFWRLVVRWGERAHMCCCWRGGRVIS